MEEFPESTFPEEERLTREGTLPGEEETSSSDRDSISEVMYKSAGVLELESYSSIFLTSQNTHQVKLECQFSYLIPNDKRAHPTE